MNEQTWERLLIDRALGALSPDVEALVEAFLEHEPDREPNAKKVHETVALARNALPEPRTLPLPPLKVCLLPQTSANREPFHRVRWPVGLAAAFAIGFALSLLTRLPDRPITSRHSEPARSIAVAQAAAPAPVESAPTEFWSAARIAGMESKVAPSQPPRLTWTSPVRKPQLNY